MDWAAVYGSAALFVALLSRISPRRSVRPFSLLLLLNWVIFQAINRRLDHLDAVEASAVMDALGMSLAINTAFRHFHWWKASLALCFGCQLLTHITIMLMPESRPALYQYRLTLNLLYVGELLSVAAPPLSFQWRQLRSRLNRRSALA